jgi:uncharacterized membrane protein
LIKYRDVLLVVLAVFNVLEFYGAIILHRDWVFIVGANAVFLLVIIFINVFQWKINKDLERRENARLKN